MFIAIIFFSLPAILFAVLVGSRWKLHPPKRTKRAFGLLMGIVLVVYFLGISALSISISVTFQFLPVLCGSSTASGVSPAEEACIAEMAAQADAIRARQFEIWLWSLLPVPLRADCTTFPEGVCYLWEGDNDSGYKSQVLFATMAALLAGAAAWLASGKQTFKHFPY